MTPVPLSASVPDVSVALAASDARIAYVGRTLVEPNGSVRCAFPGISAHLRFSGPALDVAMHAAKGPLYLDVQLDGGPFHVVAVHEGEGIYSLVEDAAAGRHTLVVVRRNEAWQGEQTYERFQLPRGGRFWPAPRLPGRKLLFVGDSVTSGELTDFRAGRAFSDPANSNSRYAYGLVLAARLAAQGVLVSCGGRGLIRDWKGDLNAVSGPQFYLRTLPEDPVPAWDPSRYVPDAIGVQLGTNDFSHDIPGRALFCNAYIAFIHRLRADAPQALILIMNSPIVNSGPKAEMLGSYLQDVVGGVHDPRVRLAHLQPRAGVPGNKHPTYADHQGMADELEPILRRELGW